MIPINKVRDLISKHTLLEKELSSGEIDKKKFAEKSKEYSDLNDIVNEAKEYLLFASLEVDGFKIAWVHAPLPALSNSLVVKFVPSWNVLLKEVPPSTSYLTWTLVVPPVL